MMQICSKCSRVNPPEASYCYYDGIVLGHSRNGGRFNPGSALFPSPFVFPSGQVCQNFDQLSLGCQQNWAAAVDLLQQGVLGSFLGAIGRADLALAAKEAARFPDLDRGLDQLLAKLPTQILEPPRLLAEPSEIFLGQVPIGGDRHFDLHLSNLGMRLLYGSVVSDSKWLTLGDVPGTGQKLFQFRAETMLPVQVRGQYLRAGTKALEGRLMIESNGGVATIVVRADVPVTPFGDGVLEGAVSPRQIAEKAKAAPQQAAALFEKGAVAQWFARNGWTYPVQGPAASGLGAVQQFFEALGLARPPRVEIKTPALSLQGRVGASLHTSLEVNTPEKRPVFAYAVTDQPWVEVGRAKLNGRYASIPVRVPHVPRRPGEVLQANIYVTANGNQRFVVPLNLSIDGSLFADMEPGNGAVEAIPVEAIPIIPGAPSVLVGAGSPAGTSAYSTQAGTAVAASPYAQPARASWAAPQPVVVPRPRGDRTSPFFHLLPLILLGLTLLMILLRDWRVAPRGEDALEYKIGLLFDYSHDPRETKKLGQTLSFGLFQIDDSREPSRAKKLTFNSHGQTNSTVVKIDGTERTFGKESSGGRWESLPMAAGRGGMTGSWAFFEQVVLTQTVEMIPGEPVEFAPGIYQRFFDTCLVRYQIQNQDRRDHRVGMRFLLDTWIGDNDGPTFEVPGVEKLIDTHMDFNSSQRVPDFIQALEFPNIKKPGTVVQINFRPGGKFELPNRVSLTRWPGNALKYSYNVPIQDIERDSAIVIYWDEKVMAPGQKRDLGFTVGLGNVSSSEGAIGLSVGGSFSPGGDLAVMALVSEPAANETVTLFLPKELSLIDGAAQQPVPAGQKLPDGRMRPSPVTWHVRSAMPGTFTIEVQSSTGKRQTRRVTIKTNTLF
jgi:hypothetical protein